MVGRALPCCSSPSPARRSPRRCASASGNASLLARAPPAMAGSTAASTLPLGRALRYFGDGQEAAKRIDGRRYWRIPVMDGEFLCEDRSRSRTAVGGGNFLILGRARAAVLAAAERAVAAMRSPPGVIMPFPGGVVRSGSKVGSKYKGLSASTNHAYCPTLKGAVESALLARRVCRAGDRHRRSHRSGGR